MRIRFLAPLVPAAAAAALVPGPASGAATADVVTAGVTFSPQRIEVAPGDSVHWTNGGGTHNVVFDDGTYRSGDPTANVELGSRAFDVPGTYGYVCELHAGLGMTGVVVVRAPEPTPTPTPTPSPSPVPASSPTPVPTVTSAPATVPGLPPEVSRLRIAARVRGGRLRGSVVVAPAGATLVLVARFGGDRAGRFELVPAKAGRAPFAIELGRGARTALRNRGSLRVRVTATAASGGRVASVARSKRVR